MSYEQLATFLAVCSDTYSKRIAALFLAETGLRPGECCAMQWWDFDAVGRTLLAHRAVTNSGRIKSTKTGESRTLHLSPRSALALTTLQASLEAEALLAGKDGIGPWIF